MMPCTFSASSGAARIRMENLLTLRGKCLLFIVCLHFCPASSTDSPSLSLRPQNSQNIYTASSNMLSILHDFTCNPNSPANFACHGYKRFFCGMIQSGNTLRSSCGLCTNDKKWLILRRFLDLRTLLF